MLETPTETEGTGNQPQSCANTQKVERNGIGTCRKLGRGCQVERGSNTYTHIKNKNRNLNREKHATPDLIPHRPRNLQSSISPAKWTVATIADHSQLEKEVGNQIPLPGRGSAQTLRQDPQVPAAAKIQEFNRK